MTLTRAVLLNGPLVLPLMAALLLRSERGLNAVNKAAVTIHQLFGE